jgi:two-component system, chemotaxis family, chemotaxis protein CheY
VSIKRIVIADDSSTARMFIQRCLEIAGLDGAEFAQASDGEEALALLQEAPADLLVTDLVMPGLGGMALLERIAASPKLHGLPVVVITSECNPARREKIRDLGALATLEKPISPPAMATALAPLLEEGDAS